MYRRSSLCVTMAKQEFSCVSVCVFVGLRQLVAFPCATAMATTTTITAAAITATTAAQQHCFRFIRCAVTFLCTDVCMYVCMCFIYIPMHIFTFSVITDFQRHLTLCRFLHLEFKLSSHSLLLLLLFVLFSMACSILLERE